MATVTRTSVRMEDDFYVKDLIHEGKRVTTTLTRKGKAETTTKVKKYKSEAEAFAAMDAEATRFSPGGYTVRSRKTEAVTPDEAPALFDAVDPQFERACLDNPDDAEKHRVYADWLQAQGDARGQLAALWLAGKTQEAGAVFKQNLPRLLGELSTAWNTQIGELLHHHGFPSGASLRGPYEEPDNPIPLDALTRDFLALPLAWAVTGLRFGLSDLDQENDWTSTLAMILVSKQAPRLTSLAFDDFTQEDSELSWVELGDFQQLWRGLPKLQHLHIKAGGGGELGTIEHASLQTFIRESGGLREDELLAIVGAKWPQLRRLDLWTGDENYGAEATVDALKPLLAGQGLPNLKHLGIINSELLPELITPLAASKLLPQLEQLDLSRGVLQDGDVDLLLSNRAKFAHLRRLDLTHNQLTTRLDELKRALPNADLDDQREADDGARYVSVGE